MEIDPKGYAAASFAGMDYLVPAAALRKIIEAYLAATRERESRCWCNLAPEVQERNRIEWVRKYCGDELADKIAAETSEQGRRGPDAG